MLLLASTQVPLSMHTHKWKALTYIVFGVNVLLSVSKIHAVDCNYVGAAPGFTDGNGVFDLALTVGRAPYH